MHETQHTIKGIRSSEVSNKQATVGPRTGGVAKRVAVTAVEVAGQRTTSLVTKRVELRRKLPPVLPFDSAIEQKRRGEKRFNQLRDDRRKLNLAAVDHQYHGPHNNSSIHLDQRIQDAPFLLNTGQYTL